MEVGVGKWVGANEGAQVEWVHEASGTYKKGSCLCVIRAVSKVKSQ